MKKVTSLAELRSMIVDSNIHDYFILLNGNLRSSKTIDVTDDCSKFCIVNEIDGTEQVLTESEMLDRNLTNIGYAIQNGAFFAYDF